MGVHEARRAMGRAFQSLSREHGFEPLTVEGTIPSELRGTLYKNGPAVFDCQGTPYVHWLDGDGAITAVRLRDGRAEGAVRVTLTEDLAEERRAGKMLYSSGFTKGPSWRRRLFGRAKNPTNIHVLVWQGRVFAMTEMGPPYEIDPTSLETIGPCDFGGVVSQGLNAHVRVHATTGAIYACGPRIGVSNALDVFELPVRGEVKKLTSVSLSSPPILIHDFAMSEHHLIFVKPPVSVKLAAMMAGLGSAMDAIEYEAERGTEIIVVPLSRPSEPVIFTVPEFFKLHDANAFEVDEHTLALDVCRYPSFVLGDAFMLDALRSGEGWANVPEAKLERVFVDLHGKSVRHQTIWPKNCDFPTTAPCVQGRRARYLWASVTRDGVDRVTKLDLETGEEREAKLPAHELSGEPTFVPRPGGVAEDDGWLLTVVFDARTETSLVAILDARDPSEVLARARFDHHVAFPLHGAWAPG
ncbi:MAG: carotenoid oxygenase family protein [Polyangiaceae bacterium]|nr:carotenoid oxygenase family protein [Polyangiaceae bacterium]